MTSGSQQEQRPPRTLRNMWLGFAAVLGIVAAYMAFTFWSRWQENADLAAKEKAARAAAQRDADEKSIAVLGGDEFKIISFYATPGLIHRGESVDLCYGVSNTKTVKLEPPEANVWPSVDRCLQIAPKKTTTYTFTAEDGKGDTKTATLTIQVR